MSSPTPLSSGADLGWGPLPSSPRPRPCLSPSLPTRSFPRRGLLISRRGAKARPMVGRPGATPPGKLTLRQGTSPSAAPTCASLGGGAGEDSRGRREGGSPPAAVSTAEWLPEGEFEVDGGEMGNVFSEEGQEEGEAEGSDAVPLRAAEQMRVRAAPEPGSFWGVPEGAEETGASFQEIAGIPMFEWLRLTKPARYLGNEFGAVHKEWGSSRVRFCLVYPEVYEVGASNLGHILLYTVLNRQAGVLCDRAYFVDADMAACLAKYERPLFAVESRRGLAEFDTLGFSLAYELGGTNVLEMLKLAGIPVTWEERNAWEQQRQQQREGAGEGAGGAPWDVSSGLSLPLVFAGGPTATSNPEPFADFFDFFAIGDGEECLVEISQCLEASKAKGLSRIQTLISLATSVPGVYVPQLYEHLPGWGAAALPRMEGVPARVLRRVATPDPLDQIGLVPLTSTVHDRLTVEIRRGCTRGCRFCQPGMLTRPARDVAPERVVQAVEEGMRKTGYTEFSLLSLSCSDYLALPAVGIEIKNRLKNEPISLSLPSQRVDRFNDDIASIVGGARKGSLTFAPEAGSQRLRDIINKGLTDEELLRGVKTAWDKGWRQVKLYFMIGLPGETDDDVLGIARTVKWLQRECRRGKNFLGIKLTISNFTPKPHTPFQWHSVSTEELLRKQRLLKAALCRLPGVKFYFGDVRISAMEDFIGRGDRSVGAVIRRAWELGATNDAWWNGVDECYECWSQAIEEQGLEWKYRKVLDGEWDVMEHLGDSRYRGQGQGGKGRVDRGVLADERLDAPLPWDLINTGIAKWWLKADLQKALEAATVPDCSHSGICSKCGVCSDEFGDNVVADIPEVPAFDGEFQPDRTRTQRIRLRFAKAGSVVLIGNLDLCKLFDRALRRAGLPVCYTHAFNSQPRISEALALPLGFSSCCELVDIELTKRVPPGEVRNRLQAQLPEELSLLDAWEEKVFRMDGKNEDTLTKLVSAVEYLLIISVSHSDQAGNGASMGMGALGRSSPFGLSNVREWVEAVNALEHFDVQSRSRKTGKAKVSDLKAFLTEVELLPAHTPLPAALVRTCPDVVASLRNSQETGKVSETTDTGLLACEGTSTGTRESTGCLALLRYNGTHATGVGGLRPEGLLAMLQEVAGEGYSITLLQAHRNAMVLSEASKPSINQSLLRAMVNDDGFRALYRRFDGSSYVLGDQPKDFVEAARRAQRSALAATVKAQEEVQEVALVG